MRRAMGRRAAAGFLPAVLLAWNCAGAPEAAAPARPCVAADYRALVGKAVDEMDLAVLPAPRRIYSSGSPVTMDHRPERLNIVVDADGRILRLHCG